MSRSDDARVARHGRRMLDRVAALRRSRAEDERQADAAAAAAAAPEPDAPAPSPADVDRLADRVAALEARLEGLQDSVHRQAERHDREIAGLRRQLDPRQLVRTLGEDARKRGI